MWVKALLAVVGVANVLFGAAAIALPHSTAELAHYELLNPAGAGEFRSFYGGLVFAMGVIVLHALRRPRQGREWLRALALLFLGICAGRVLSLFLDGLQTYTLFALVVEGAFCALLFEGSREFR